MTNLIIEHRYEIIEELGCGGFGQTFLAKDNRMPSQRIVVVKKLTPVNQSNIDYQIIRNSFKKEAATLENLGNQSFNIPKLYDHFEYRGNFYLIQEYIQGKTLAQISPISQNQAFFILTSLLKTLTYIHSKNIIHRDIKPENIIIRQSDGIPFLIDFGAVKDSMGKTQLHSGSIVSSKVIGTKGYMAPEQSAGCAIFSSDLYSLGRTMISALTNKLPVEFEINPLTGELDWLKYVPSINHKLVYVLNKANQISPERRYSTAIEMAEDLNFNSQIKTTVVPRKTRQKLSIINFNSFFNLTNKTNNSSVNSEEKNKLHPKNIETVIMAKSAPEIGRSLLKSSIGFGVIGLTIFLGIQWYFNNKIDEVIESAKDFYIVKKYKDCVTTAQNAIDESKKFLIFNQNTLRDESINIQNKCQFESDKELLNLAEVSKQKQSYLEAITTAQNISNYDSDMYQKAQAVISDSLSIILDNANVKYDNSGDANTSIAEVQSFLKIFVPETPFYQKITANIDKWQADEKSNKNKLAQAESELKKGDWNQAYEIADSVTISYYKKLAQPIKDKAFESKNQSYLAEAKARYNKGDLKGAIHLANQVSQNSTVYSESQEFVNQWQSELTDLESNIKSFFESYFEAINNSNYDQAWSYLSNNYQNKISQTKFQEKWQDKQVSLNSLEIISTFSKSIRVNIMRNITSMGGTTTTSESFCLDKNNQLFSQFKIELTEFCK